VVVVVVVVVVVNELTSGPCSSGAAT